ncbi:hypothetical protein BJ508DRAFT_305418 [Ascobolus immersus RN42]|uniref:Uncharacterized protein n=1 Tax=Ascobolus immersus RN42 TaxID=1160509 RepID=A0A3N4IEG6_ASCIM|nr:hypothetical protein BJ508DRAFT_305418 [Ascobolus immersus RN42]
MNDDSLFQAYRREVDLVPLTSPQKLLLDAQQALIARLLDKLHTFEVRKDEKPYTPTPLDRLYALAREILSQEHMHMPWPSLVYYYGSWSKARGVLETSFNGSLQAMHFRGGPPLPVSIGDVICEITEGSEWRPVEADVRLYEQADRERGEEQEGKEEPPGWGVRVSRRRVKRDIERLECREERRRAEGVFAFVDCVEGGKGWETKL